MTWKSFKYKGFILSDKITMFLLNQDEKIEKHRMYECMNNVYACMNNSSWVRISIMFYSFIVRFAAEFHIVQVSIFL